jgi:hypothetical protein
MRFLVRLLLGRTFLFCLEGYGIGGNKMAKGKGKGIGGIIGGALGAAALNALVPAIEPTINKVVDKVAEEFEKQNDLISVPDTYAKGFPLTINQATDLVLSAGLKATACELTMKEADPKYKDCIESQVVISNPPQRKKVKPGSMVFLKYITQDVIDESQRLFDEQEKQKAEIKAEKAAKFAEQKKAVIDAGGKTVSGIKSLIEKRGQKTDTPNIEDVL